MNIKKIINSIFSEFIYGSHIIALDASAMVVTIMLLTNQTINFVLVLIPYLVAQVIYSYNHFQEADSDEKDNPERAAIFKQNKRGKIIVFFIYIFLLSICLLLTNLSTSLLIISIFILGMLYTLYFKRLKITGFKSYYVSAVWVLIVLIVPLMMNQKIDSFYIFTMIIYFLTALASTIFFDLKDIVSDRDSGVKTFPVILGMKKTQYLLNFIKLISFILVVIGVYFKIIPTLFILYPIAILYGVVYINGAFNLKNKRLRLISHIVADAEFLFWLFIIVLYRFLF